MKVFFRWLGMNKWEVLFSLLLIMLSLAIVFQFNFIAGALNALRIPYAVFVTVYTVFFFIRNNKLMLTGGLIACLILYPGIWRYFKPGQVPIAERVLEERLVQSSQHADFSVAHYNVKENNKQMQQLAEDALTADADLLSMQEIRPETFPDIDAVLHPKYPYSKVSLDIKGFGIALYSRYPITEDSTYIVNRFPVLTGVVEVPGGKVRYVCATISTPKSEKGFERQTKEFQLLAQLVRQDTLPVILIGDLNTVPWSTQMEFLLQKARLKDSRKDLAATFPSQSVLVQIPIDYILHGESLDCLDFHTLSKSTSNHLGIMGYYTFIQK